MPWIQNLANFISPAIVSKEKNTLAALGCKIMTIQQVWQCVEEGFPDNIQSVNIDDYCNLLKKIAGAKLQISAKIAADGWGHFCHPNALFDHNDPLFTAAFRRKENRYFLHKDLRRRELDAFWNSKGLRTRPASGSVVGSDFLLCATEIQRRLDNTHPENLQDAVTVAEYLRWDRPCLHEWLNDIWNKLSGLGIFAAADDLSAQFVYRRPRMKELAQKKSHYSLQELGREVDKRIIWSQKPFAKVMPVPFAFARIPCGGKPTVMSVFCHLTYLIGIHKSVGTTELAEYLRDIQASYTYLQDHAEETAKISCIQSAEMWINLDTSDVGKVKVDDISTALCSARLLCMNCPSDPLPLKVARKFLVPYERLLSVLGCPSVVQPPKKPKRAMDNIGSPMVSVMKQIQKFRQEGKLVDIIFQAEGRNKPAHKIFMAAVSEYCGAQFTGAWGQLPRDKTEVIKLDDIKFKALSQMVDFAYTGEVHFSVVMDRSNNDEIAERLDELLDLLRGTDRWLLGYLHQLTEDHIIDNADM